MRYLVFIFLTLFTTTACAAPLTAGKIPKAKNGAIIIDSVMTEDDNGNIGISDNTPSAKLDVGGDAIVQGSVTASSGFVGNLTGNASTATLATAASALATNPTACSANQFVTDLDADGTLTCDTAGNASIDLTALDQGVYFDTANVYDIGSTTAGPAEIYVDSTLYVNDGAVRLVSDGGIYGETITLSGAGQSYCGTSYTENCVYVGAHATNVKIGPNLDVDGAIYADYFWGDGSHITGVASANTTANAVPKSTGSTLVDSGIYVVAGNTGIGDTTPDNFFEVQGDTDIDGTIYIGGPSGVFASVHRRQNSPLQVKSVAVSTSPIQIMNSSGWQILLISESASGDGQINLKDSTSTTKFLVNPGGDTYITGTGNVGIGTNIPASALDVGGFSRTSVSGSYSWGNAGVKGSLEVDTSVYIDTALYLTNSSSAIYGKSGSTCYRCPIASGSITCTAMASCPPGY